jgi:membrane protease YdiL (CAAX protease family)
MLGVWAVVLLVFLLVAVFSGQASLGRPFVATMITFALLLAGMLLFAARDFPERISALAGPASGWVLGVAVFFIFLIYAFGTATASLTRIAVIALFLFLPLAVLATTPSAPSGTWQDFFTLSAIWIAVKFGPSHWIWPYPAGRLSYIFTVMLASNMAIAGFVLLRRAKNIGYQIGWGANWTLHTLGSLVVFASIAIPLGIDIHFIAYSPHTSEWKSFVPLSIAILCFTAWPEEFLFRGLLQNFLSRAAKNDTAGWIAASILFGFSHITNMHFPNWRYVLLASIAGLFYGWTWRKTGSIFASALVHASVDVIWHFLFRSI